MRKNDLVNNIANKTGLPKVDILLTLEKLFEDIKENMVNGHNVYIRGFGTFYAKKKAPKVGRNVKKNIAINIPEHYVPSFRPNKVFLNDMKTKCKIVLQDNQENEE